MILQKYEIAMPTTARRSLALRCCWTLVHFKNDAPNHFVVAISHIVVILVPKVGATAFAGADTLECGIEDALRQVPSSLVRANCRYSFLLLSHVSNNRLCFLP